MRKIEKKYEDPLSLVWLHAAEQMGLRIERSAEVNASWDGVGVLTIGTPETLDADDSLAQMILHEVCHALCEGPESLARLDWGLGSEPDKKVHEHAALRLQAALADQIGMRAFFASTTIFRHYYDQLPADPLAKGDDPAIALAQVGWERAHAGPWAEALAVALERTAQIAAAIADIATPDSLWCRSAR
ncbi:hypothetical protein [Botrimarina hoheduenensis]|uniref:hypothetical protein n=1 Tax=Botrimarina hoheduenensis TaxID=2528000 RepID=UPI0011B39CFB|nr:hypothetical protein [Botrimarina hoheduenensis]